MDAWTNGWIFAETILNVFYLIKMIAFSLELIGKKSLKFVPKSADK